MSRGSRLVEALESLKADEVIEGYVHMGDKWLVQLGLHDALYMTNQETESFVRGAEVALDK